MCNIIAFQTAINIVIMLRLASLTQPNFEKLARASGTAQLITIDFSHYAEFSRWCLQRKGKPFAEHAYAPVAHVLPVLSLRACGPQKHLSESSRMLGVSADGGAPQLSERALKNKGATAVPVLVTSSGTVLRDSWEIAEYAGFEPVESALKKILDEDLGPLSRQLCYSYVLKESNSSVCDAMFVLCGGLPWKFLWFMGLGYFVKRGMSSSMRVQDPEAVYLCRSKLKQTFSQLSDIMKNKSTPYLAGDVPGAADFALAALASPVVGAHDYNLGKYDHLFVRLESMDRHYTEEIEYWRNTDVGKHCLHMYEHFRREVEK